MEYEDLDNVWDQIINHLDHDKVSCEIGLVRIRGYVESVERLLDERKNQLKQNKPLLRDGMSEEEQEEIWTEWARDIYEIEYDITKIQRYSIFVYSYSFFEDAFKEITDSYGFMHNLQSFSSYRKRDTAIVRCRKYLKNTGKIDWPEPWSTWQDIVSLHLIRNLIVHNDGCFHKEQDKNPSEDFLKSWNTGLSSETYEIELLPGFIFRVLDTFKKFLEELYAKF